MGYITDKADGWTTTRKGPYHVEEVGPYKIPAVCDNAGFNALAHESGAVFMLSMELAETLCKLANDGELS